MQILIHAVPSRMWYVEEFLVPSLRAQGLEPEIFCDTKRIGNLKACLASFSGLTGSGDTWHLQDDVLIARDFAERAARIPAGAVVNAFAFERSGDHLDCIGSVYPPDLWNGFPCVRIPNEFAREFAEWIKTAHHDSWQDIMIKQNRADDFLFNRYLEEQHPIHPCYNVAPNLVEHVDWLIGGSMVNEWRGYICRSDLWNDEELVQELKQKIKNR